MTVFEKYCKEFAELVEQLIRRDADHAVMLQRKLQAAEKPQDKHLVIKYICYAANSKMLRDTDDPHIHELCRQIIAVNEKFIAVATIDLFPDNILQKWQWRLSIGLRKSRWFFQAGDCLRVGVLFCEFQESKHFKLGRIWHNYSNYQGESVDAVIPITTRQAQQVIAAKNRLMGEQ